MTQPEPGVCSPSPLCLPASRAVFPYPGTSRPGNGDVMNVAVESEPRVVATQRSPRKWVRVSLSLAVPALAGALIALTMPRGPVTPWDAVVSLVVGAIVGLASGWLAGRWAIVVAPAVFVVCFEMGRIGLDAPSLDGIHFDSALGIVLFATTRGFHALVALVPMIWGAVIGSSASRRAQRDHTGPGQSLPRVATVSMVVVLATASVLIVRPPHTDPIVGADGAPLAGSIAELATVDVNGSRQSVVIRGVNRSNPILLYLTGGPGNSDLGYTRAFLHGLEEDFVLVAWDQRGAGKSYPALDPVSTLTLESAVTDVVQLSEYLANRFEQERIYLFGNSWGSLIGVLAAEQRPDLYHAYIGAGQMVNPLATDLILYRQMLEYAERTGDDALLDRMRGFGEPPYAKPTAYMTVIEHYGDLEPYRETSEFAAGPPGIQGTGVPEYGFMDKLNVFRGLADMGSALYAQAQDLDLRRDAPALSIPVFLVQGAHELTARSLLADEYARMLRAPSVTVEVFDDSGHVPHFEEAARFRQFLVDVVLSPDPA